jgi:RNase H-fold protein (predicted Holliday junction resolvase)
VADQVADPSAVDDAAPAGPTDDLAILAEIQADQGETPDVEADDGVEVEGDDSGAGKPRPITDEKPDDEKPVDPPKADESAETKKARAILASATRKLARAQFLSKRDREAIVNGLKTRPHEQLRELGTSIGEVLDAAPPEPGEAPAKTLEERLAAVEAREQAQEAREQQARVAAEVDQLRANIVTDIKAQTAEFPLVNRSQSHDLVIETMVEYFKEHQQPLPHRLAAKQVEEYLQSLAGPDISPAPGANRNGTPQPKRSGSVTLGNNDTRNVPPSPDDLPMDADERAKAVGRSMGLKM